MLYIVLLLVLVALGLLVAALTTANTLWAWLSIAISLAGAAILVMDWLGNRRRRAAAEDAPVEAVPATASVAASAPAEAPAGSSAAPASAGSSASAVSSAVSTPAPAEPPGAAERPPGDSPTEVVEDEPGEEPTDASDLLVVSELSAEVRVVDEHPRYHLPSCGWLVGRPTIPVPVSEARQLGFTPCARCAPDSTLAARHREAGRG